MNSVQSSKFVTELPCLVTPCSLNSISFISCQAGGQGKLRLDCAPSGNKRNTYPNLWQGILMVRLDTGSNLQRKRNMCHKTLE